MKKKGKQSLLILLFALLHLNVWAGEEGDGPGAGPSESKTEVFAETQEKSGTEEEERDLNTDPPPPCENCDPGVPIDGGLSLLLVAGAAYGVKKYKSKTGQRQGKGEDK